MKKKGRFRERHMLIALDAWNYAVNVVLTTDIEKSRQKINKAMYDIEVDETIDGLCVPSKSASWILLGFDASAGVVAHECWHAVWNLSQWAGVELENETIAYHLGYLVQRTTDFLKRERSRR
jgi:hypothetical protein